MFKKKVFINDMKWLVIFLICSVFLYLFNDRIALPYFDIEAEGYERFFMLFMAIVMQFCVGALLLMSLYCRWFDGSKV